MNEHQSTVPTTPAPGASGAEAAVRDAAAAGESPAHQSTPRQRAPRRSNTHVVAVRWRFGKPVTLAEARAALRDCLPASPAPERAMFVRDGEIEECDLFARLATKTEAADGKR
jgi:hypothetical protein